jgi:arylsulfatase A
MMAGFLAAALMLGHTVLASDSSNKPNILLILADDLGWADLACYGNEFHETPNLDRLAKGGMLFTNAYAASTVCSPTRASILSGKYPARTGVTDWIPGRVYPEKPLECPSPKRGMDLEEFTIAEALKDVGYATASIGKWHVGASPAQQGFDVEIVATGSSYFSPYRSKSLPDGPDGEYRTDRLTSEAISVIKKWEDDSKPWFVYLPYCSVHAPITAKPETIAKYAKKGPGKQGKNNCRFAAMLEHLDENVGRLMDHLEASGQAKNTLIIFFSDNGGKATAQTPLRGRKGQIYEGGIRVPLIIRYPGLTAPGSRCDTSVISTDRSWVLFAQHEARAGFRCLGQSLFLTVPRGCLSGSGTRPYAVWGWSTSRMMRSRRERCFASGGGRLKPADFA